MEKDVRIIRSMFGESRMKPKRIVRMETDPAFFEKTTRNGNEEKNHLWGSQKP